MVPVVEWAEEEGGAGGDEYVYGAEGTVLWMRPGTAIGIAKQARLRGVKTAKTHRCDWSAT